METKIEDTPNSKNPNDLPRSDKDRQFDNTERDEGTLGVRHDREARPNEGLADDDQPTWQPPESIPEPRPADPIMNPTRQTNQSTNTNSPA